MKIALRSHEVGMSPDELIEFTIDQNWQGINVSYTKNKINQMIAAESSALSNTRNRSLSQDLSDASWGSTKTRDLKVADQLEDNSWAN